LDAGRRAQQQSQAAAAYADDDAAQWHAMAIECRDNRSLRGSREREFLDGVIRWTASGGEPSPKQQTWLRDIYARPTQPQF
jgi:hypothetical protein